MSDSSDITSIHFSCAICNHVFEAKVKRPLVLPCSHSFCQDCLQKLEAAQDKMCPLCRKSWNHLSVADFPSCYQLIPSATEPQKHEAGISKSGASSYTDVCGEHFEDYNLWCETCDVPACRKCWKWDHKRCNILLLEEKCESLLDRYSKSVTSLKESHQSKHPIQLADNKKHIMNVRDFIGKLKTLEEQLLDHEKSLETWSVSAETILADEIVSKASSLRDVLEICQKTSTVENLALQLSAQTNPLLLQLAHSYQESQDDASEFISNLKKNLDEVQKNENVSANGLATNKTDADMKEGGVWVISDIISAEAVDKLMLTTSLRPSSLRVTWTSKPEQQFALILNNCLQLDVDFELDCFSNFDKTCQQNREICSALIMASARCRVTRFWGHLDVMGLQRLPKTIQSLGLVMRDQQDPHVLNSFIGIVIQHLHSANNQDRLIWKNWTELNLSMANTFRKEHWIINWRLYNAQGKHELVSLPSALIQLGVSLRLYLHQLVPQDIRWMGDILRAMAISFPNPVPLFLPGAKVDPDPILGVLRDSGQRWEVHLPASLPQLAPRGEVAERYKIHGHSITWDLL